MYFELNLCHYTVADADRCLSSRGSLPLLPNPRLWKFLAHSGSGSSSISTLTSCSALANGGGPPPSTY